MVGNAIANHFLVSNPNFYTFALLVLQARSSVIDHAFELFAELIANIGLEGHLLTFWPRKYRGLHGLFWVQHL